MQPRICEFIPTDPPEIPLAGDEKEALIGVELEIERCRGIVECRGIYTEPDGSLRNNGMEFITVPGHLTSIKNVISDFFNRNKDSITSDNYSDRCSIHVHMNVRDMNVTQFKNLIKLYLLYEIHLFKYGDVTRIGNIFCTPLQDAPAEYPWLWNDRFDTIPRICRNWVKYTALNLHPVGTQGTVEFRHMPGTCAVDVIHNWLDILNQLYQSAMQLPQDTINVAIMSLNSNSQYHQFTKTVFGSFSDLITCQETFVEDMYAGIVCCKRSMP